MRCACAWVNEGEVEGAPEEAVWVHSPCQGLRWVSNCGACWAGGCGHRRRWRWSRWAGCWLRWRLQRVRVWRQGLSRWLWGRVDWSSVAVLVNG
eukprot:4121742-Alexandrium_andersonii.AAC.1